MDIGLLYQEYRRERKRSTGHHHSAKQQQQRQKQQQQSAAQSNFLRGIGRAVPSLLAPSTRCSPGSKLTTVSLPPSASDQPWPPSAQSGPSEPGPMPPPTLPTSPEVQPPQPPMSEPAEVASPRRRFSPIAAKRRIPTSETSAAAAISAPADATSASVADPGAVGTGRGQRRTATLDVGGGGGGGHQLVAIDPRDVKSVLTQVVSATMRDLLGRDQDARERSLLRQIRRTLGEFESSMTSIVKSFIAFRQQPEGHHRPGILNNSAGNICDGAGVASTGSGVCVSDVEADADAGVGVGVAAVSSRDSGQSIRESCCPSDDRTTNGTQVPLGDSDSDCLLPLRYRQLSKLGCTSCSCAVGNRSREQKNFNHASSSSDSSIDSSIDSSSSNSMEIFYPRRDHTAVTVSHLRRIKNHQRSFPRFPVA